MESAIRANVTRLIEPAPNLSTYWRGIGVIWKFASER
jgi:hypothetical protein